MFIVVRYGDDQQQIFNPQCITQSLIDNIMERCECPKQDIIDLTDEGGIRKNLQQHLLEDGAALFTNRETLILLRVEKYINSQGEEEIIYKPLLEGLDDGFNETLSRRLNSSSTYRTKSRNSTHSSRRSSTVNSTATARGTASRRTSTTSKTATGNSAPRVTGERQGRKK